MFLACKVGMSDRGKVNWKGGKGFPGEQRALAPWTGVRGMPEGGVTSERGVTVVAKWSRLGSCCPSLRVGILRSLSVRKTFQNSGHLGIRNLCSVYSQCESEQTCTYTWRLKEQAQGFSSVRPLPFK